MVPNFCSGNPGAIAFWNSAAHSSPSQSLDAIYCPTTSACGFPFLHFTVTRLRIKLFLGSLHSNELFLAELDGLA